MAAVPPIQDHHLVVFPREPIPGSLSVIVLESRAQELRELETERQVRVWTVRGIVSDHIPLSGGSDASLARASHHLLELNENPLSIYLHRGGDNVTFYDLVARRGNQLDYVEVRVETDLPSNAFLLARQPLNELLDVIVRGQPIPLLYKHLELISPRDGGIVAYQMILPFRDGIRLGPLGGIMQWPPFAPYEAIFREAITSTSPFYQLLCACRVYEGTNHMRRWLREQNERFGIQERLPGDPPVEANELLQMGFTEEFAVGVRTAADLFNKLRPHRNAIAHFLVEGDEGQAHVYVANGEAYYEYSLGAALLLRYARQTIAGLRGFYTQHVERRLMGGSVLPGPENRDHFIVRDPNLRERGEAPQG